MSAPALRTRKPTGLPSWPIGLIAGVEGSGKSWKLAEASASPMIHRTLWVGLGEDDPDEYGVIEGARFEIVEHDGTYRGLLNALTAAKDAEPGPNGEPNLIVLDSGSRLWALLSGNAQETANERWRKKNEGKAFPDDEVPVSMDLWNVAKDRWGHVLDVLREHQGPSLITSRLELVTVMDARGNPTKEKFWKPSVEKNTPYDVGFMVQMRASYPESESLLAKVKSARYKHEVDAKGKPKPQALPDTWSVEWLWRALGLAEQTTPRVHTQTVQQGASAEATSKEQLLQSVADAATAAGVSLGQIAQDWLDQHGHNIQDTADFGSLELLRDDLLVQAQRRTAENGAAA